MTLLFYKSQEGKIMQEKKKEERQEIEFVIENDDKIKCNLFYPFQQFQHHNNYSYDLNQLVHKNYMDYFVSTDNIYLFAVPNEQHYREKPYDYDLGEDLNEIKNENENYIEIKNEYDDVVKVENYVDHNLNSNLSFLPVLWNHEIKKEIQQERDYYPVEIKQEHFQDLISHYILLDPADHYFKLNEPLNSNNKLKTPKEIRKQKVKKYLLKKQKRCFQKKITYQCRKIVADKRIRLKGRFINYTQAITELGLDPDKNYQCSYLKQLIRSLESINTNN